MDEEVEDGVIKERKIVKEKENIIGKVEFEEEDEKMEKIGVKVEVIGEKELKKIGMGEIIGVEKG